LKRRIEITAAARSDLAGILDYGSEVFGRDTA
jgi:hypothetical protein